MSENNEPSQSSKQPEAQSEATGGAPGSDATGATSESVNASSTAESSTASSSAAPSESGASAAGAESSVAGGTSTAASSPATSGAEISALAANSHRSVSAMGAANQSSTKSHPEMSTGAGASRTKSTGETSAAAMTTSAAGGGGSSVRSSRKSRTDAATASAGAAGSRADSAQQQPQQPSPSGATKRGRPSQKLGQLKLEDAKIGIIGAGKMADALVQGLIHYVKIQPGRIHLAAPSAKNLEHFKNYGCRVTKRNYDIFGRYDCDIIFLCFHGYVIKHCYKLGGSKPHPLTTNYIPHQRHPIYILSMVSGVSLTQIKACLLNPESSNRYTLEIHRIMMNTAVGHGLGICAIDCEPDSKKLSAPIRQLLSRVAQLEYVPASQMDAACALGGSGLAFSYYFINALADGAFKMGLSRKQAIRFASKTASCAAQTMLESGKHPAELRDTVSAPSGAAIYGIHVLERNDVASGVTAAVEAAHKRAIDLATQETS